MKSDPLITYRRKPASLDLASLESFAETLRTRVARGREFHCRITGDDELQNLNRQFRGQNYPTDVLSFPNDMDMRDHGRRRNGQLILDKAHPSSALMVKGAFLGDIAISLPRARTQAKDYNHTTEQELQILLLHGVLHLTGLDHESDQGQMKKAETNWRKKLGLPTSLIERASQ